jgi:hypothetical protein
MFFVKRLPPTDNDAEIKPPQRLLKRIQDNWLFVLGARTLGLGVLCGFW